MYVSISKHILEMWITETEQSRDDTSNDAADNGTRFLVQLARIISERATVCSLVRRGTKSSYSANALSLFSHTELRNVP